MFVHVLQAIVERLRTYKVLTSNFVFSSSPCRRLKISRLKFKWKQSGGTYRSRDEPNTERDEIVRWTLNILESSANIKFGFSQGQTKVCCFVSRVPLAVGTLL